MRKELKPFEINGVKSFYGKAQVETNGNVVDLYSYNTKVATVVYDNNHQPHVTMLMKASATTTRHIMAFLQQAGFANMLANVSGFRNIVKTLKNHGQEFETKQY